MLKFLTIDESCRALLRIAMLAISNLQAAPDNSDLSGQLLLPNSRWGKTTLEQGLYGKKFTEFAPRAEGLIVDVGAGWWGVNTVPILDQGLRVVAVDIEYETLAALKLFGVHRVKRPEYEENVDLLLGKFPDLDFEPNSVGSMLIASVLHFSKPREIKRMMDKVCEWLVPGGKLFVETQTPFIYRRVLENYHKRVSSNPRWPGMIKVPTYDKKRAVLRELNLFDRNVLRHIIEEAKCFERPKDDDILYFSRPDYPDELTAHLGTPRVRRNALKGTHRLMESVGGVFTKRSGIKGKP